jgi:hypothetical protein
MASMVRVAKSFDPQPMEKQIYSDGYRLYQKIVRSMWDIWDENKNFIQKYSKNKETT